MTGPIDDIDQIMHIMGVAFDPQWGEAWNRRQITESMVMPNTHHRLVDANGENVARDSVAAGFTLVRAAPGEEELLLIAVDPAERGKGIGRALLSQVFADAHSRGASQVFLEMRENNPALNLYKSVGFRPIGRRPEYYSAANGQRIAAITFAKEIP